LDDTVLSRCFPPPWTIEETDACFIVRDANGHVLACKHKLPELLHRPQ
jgi:hypothetical protein